MQREKWKKRNRVGIKARSGCGTLGTGEKKGRGSEETKKKRREENDT